MILQVVPSTHRRGSEVFGVDLGEALVRRGRLVETVALAPGQTGHSLALSCLGPSRRSPTTIRALRRRLGQAEAVVAHGSTTLAVTALATLGTRIPFAYRSVGDPAYWSSTPLRRLRVAGYLRRASRVVALWEGAADFLTHVLHVPVGRVSVIPNAVDARRFPLADARARAAARARLRTGSDLPLVMILSSLTPEKDVASTIRALAEVPHAHLMVVGDGPLREPLGQLAAEVVPGRATFLGTTDDPGSLFAAADVVALSSLTEGMPAALIEAGLTGVPAVATDVGGIRQIVIDGETGRLVPTGSPSSLAGALREVLGSNRPLGVAARAHCLSKFDIETVAEPWGDVIDHLQSGA